MRDLSKHGTQNQDNLNKKTIKIVNSEKTN